MKDQDKTRQQFISEVEELRRRVTALEGVESRRKQAEVALRENEERFRKVFEEGPIGIALVSTDGRIRHANRRFCEMLGYSESEIIAVGLAGISHPDDWERDRPFVSRLWRGEISCYHVEKRYLRKDRQVVWGQLTVSLMHDETGRPINTIGMVEDITERKQAEERLQERERMLRTLMDASPESILLMDSAGTVLLANETTAHRFGRPVDKIIGRKAKDLLSPEVAAKRMRHLDEVVRTGKASRFDDERFDRYIENAMHPILDEQGKVASVAVLGIDRTEQKSAEEALQKAHDELEQRVEEHTAELTKANEALAIFRKFAESSGEGFGMSDFDGRIVYANPSLCRLFAEEKPEDVIDKNVSTYYLPEYVQRRKDEMIPTLLREGYWHAEQTVLPRHGKPIQTLQSTFLIRDESGNPFRIAVVVTDITGRKRVEEALRQSHDELRAIYDSLGDGLLIADRETFRLVRANASICSMLGYSEEELLSMSIADLHPKEALPAIVELLREEIDGRLADKNNVPMLRKDGSVFYADITGDTFTYQGRPCSLGVFRDVTERRQSQAALERERRTLKHMLKASDHERRLIAYEIHDGLAQELAGAIMQFQIYAHAQQTKSKDAAKVFDAGMTMLRQSHFEARRLISGVRPPILDESGVLAAIAHLVHEPAFDKGPKIDFRSRVTFNRLAPILENVVYRIVQEGLTNARNHSKSPKIVVSLMQRDNRLRIKIQDWGIGFDPKTVRENCFGLKGIRGRARILRGKCSIRSKPGEGTVVVVELPVLEQQVDE